MNQTKFATWSLLLALLTLVALGGSAHAQSRSDKQSAKLAREFESKKRTALVEAGHRHLELGIWCRDKGLVAQASMQFIAAVEVSEHRHPGAERVLSIMRSMGEDFWKKRRRKTHNKLLEQYESRNAKAVSKGQKARFGLAKWAWGKDLDEGREEYLRLVELNDAALEFDKQERIVLPAGTLPAELSQEIRDDAVKINERLWLRDKFLAKLPDVSAIHEVESERLRVRSQVSLEQAQHIHEACSALLPVLTEDTDGWPQQLMNVFVFEDSATYEAYLEVSGMSDYKVAAGLALSRADIALVNSQGRSEDDTLAIALHEVAHLFMYGISRSRMPSWYSEGFAETYGGQGCFEWDGESLTTRGVMSDFRLAGLKSGESYIPLRSMLTSDAMRLMNANLAGAHGFYAQSWAFMRYLREGAGSEVRERFEVWEDMCRGKALGALFDRPTELGDVQPASALFEEQFEGDYDELESGFRAYLQTL